MKKRLFSLVLAVLLCLSLVPGVSASEEQGAEAVGESEALGEEAPGTAAPVEETEAVDEAGSAGDAEPAETEGPAEGPEAVPEPSPAGADADGEPAPGEGPAPDEDASAEPAEPVETEDPEALPEKEDAAEEEPQTDGAAFKSSYGVNLASDGYQKKGLNPYYNYRGTKTNGQGGECTWYCWGRAYEKLGVKLPWFSGDSGNAKNWGTSAFKAGYTVDTTPAANTIMVSTGGTWGHVMFVEKIVNNTAYITEGNYTYGDYHSEYHEDTVNLKTWQKAGNKNPLTGVQFIHLVASPTPTPAPTGKEMSSGYDRTLPDGDYEIVSLTNTGYLADISGDEVPAYSKANVQLWTRSAAPRAQDVFTLTYLNNGFYSIMQMGSNMSLDVSGGSKALRANIQMYASNGSSAQQWAISNFTNGGSVKGYQVQARCSGFYLDVNGGTVEKRTNIQLYSGNSTLSQGWLFIPYQPEQPIADGRYILASVLEGYELDVAGDTGNVQDGVNVQLWRDTCPSRYNSFDVTALPNGYYKLTHAASGKVLEVSGGSSVRGSNIDLGTDTGSDAQQWAVTRVGDGYVLRARCSGMALDVQGGTAANGTTIRQWTYNGANAQRFTFAQAEHTVSFDPNGGDGGPSAQTKYYKNGLTLPEETPERSCHTFLGWSRDRDAEAPEFRPGDVYAEDEDLTLFAVWAEGVAGGWTTDKPTGVEEDRIESRTEYRYADRETKVTTTPEQDGWTLKSSGWKQTSSGTVDYVKTWPSGFLTSHNLYAKYHNTPKTAGETASSRTEASASVVGYIYWHWCYNSYAYGPINRKVDDHKSSTYPGFHAFYSTTNATQKDSSGQVRQYANAGVCKDTHWYYQLPVYRQTYTVYAMEYTYERWGGWSDWSETPQTANEDREVEVRTVYRVIGDTADVHAWDQGGTVRQATAAEEGLILYTCEKCGKTRTETVPRLTPSPTATPAPTAAPQDLRGDYDRNGRVDIRDHVYLSRALKGVKNYTRPEKMALSYADLNGDGVVNRLDRIYLARALRGMRGYTL